MILMKFEEHLSNPSLLKHIQAQNYQEMTPIQEKVIPLILQQNDVIGQSRTGSGKTAAYALPILETIDFSLSYTQALVLIPTRELCQQVADEFRKFCDEHTKIVSLSGGELITKQWDRLDEGKTIIVATPGRLLDHLRRKKVHLQRLQTLVIDEADDLLAMGFAEEIQALLPYLPEYRQTLLFSATMPKSILTLSKNFQDHPVHIHIAPKETTASTITQEVYQCSPHQKMELLRQLILIENPKSCMVFANTKKKVDELLADLIEHKQSVAALHGDMSQEARNAVMERFKSKQFQILVASDIACRGIDIDRLDLVINFDIPKELDNYVHRIGRTGRIDHHGKAITLATPQKPHELADLEKHIKQQLIRKPLPTQKELNDALCKQLEEEVALKLEKEIPTSVAYEHLTQAYDKEELLQALLHIVLSSRQVNELSLKPEETPSKPKMNFATIRLTLGKRDKVAAAHILSAIAEAAEISGKDIGRIVVNASDSYVEVPQEKVNFILSRIHTITICGQAFTAKQVNTKEKK